MKTPILAQEDGEITLQYEGKTPTDDILQKTKPAELRISREPQQAVVGWSNMLVYGDNLNVLKTFYDRGDIRPRLCYIDPPFATGREFNGVHGSRKETKGETVYTDTLKGKEFLESLRKRLVFIQRILAKDGSIYVHIDWKMSHYVRILMDEVFGPDHFINEITRVKANPKNFERPAYGNIKDTILFYSKGDEYVWNGSREKLTKEEIVRLFPRVDKDGRRYATIPLHAPSETKKGPTGQPWRGIPPPKGRHWRVPPERLTLLDKLGVIEWSSKGNPRKKIYADEARRRGKKRQDIWYFLDPAYPRYPTEKNLEMLKTIIETSSDQGDIILDAYAGSATTLVAASQLGRRWVGIDDSKVAIRVAQERLTEGKKSPAFSLYETVI